MKSYKRLTLLCGHYGSGKTNVAVNMALRLKQRVPSVTVADLDIVNPYFRTKDSKTDFDKAGIALICSEYANTNVDIPALPPDIYKIVDKNAGHFIIDVGGDDRGAYALGRIAPDILRENDYDMLMIINKYRPLTPDAPSTLEVMREIEAACGIRFTGIVNNSNLGEITTAQDVLDSLGYADEVSTISGLPLLATTIHQSLYEQLAGKIEDLIPMQLQHKLSI